MSTEMERVADVTRFIRGIGPERHGARLDAAGDGDEVGRLAREINRMLDRLGAALGAQERFNGEVSHELRTPISTLLLEAQVLMRSAPDQVALERFVASVEEEMRRLGSLVESLLTLARAGCADARVPHVPVDINNSAVEAAQCCWPLARAREVRIAMTLLPDDGCPGGPVVEGDPELLRTLISNLLRNAVGISPRAAAVDLQVEADRGTVVVRVRDRGPGVPERLAPRLFTPFNSADPPRHNGPGTGLGLSIVREIANLHGGTVEFRNLPPAEGGGAEFVVRLPLHPSVSAAGEPHAAAP